MFFLGRSLAKALSSVLLIALLLGPPPNHRNAGAHTPAPTSLKFDR